MNILFSILSAAYIAAIFLLADSPVVSDIAPFNPYSLLHIPLYGILTILLILSFSPSKGKSVKSKNSSNTINPTSSRKLLIAGLIAIVVAIADEIHQAYIPSREASFLDIFLDIIGIVLVIFLLPWEKLQSYRANKSSQAEAQRDNDEMK